MLNTASPQVVQRIEHFPSGQLSVPCGRPTVGILPAIGDFYELAERNLRIESRQPPAKRNINCSPTFRATLDQAFTVIESLYSINTGQMKQENYAAGKQFLHDVAPIIEKACDRKVLVAEQLGKFLKVCGKFNTKVSPDLSRAVTRAGPSLFVQMSGSQIEVFCSSLVKARLAHIPMMEALGNRLVGLIQRGEPSLEATISYVGMCAVLLGDRVVKMSPYLSVLTDSLDQNKQKLGMGSARLIMRAGATLAGQPDVPEHTGTGSLELGKRLIAIAAEIPLYGDFELTDWDQQEVSRLRSFKTLYNKIYVEGQRPIVQIVPGMEIDMVSKLERKTYQILAPIIEAINSKPGSSRISVHNNSMVNGLEVDFVLQQETSRGPKFLAIEVGGGNVHYVTNEHGRIDTPPTDKAKADVLQRLGMSVCTYTVLSQNEGALIARLESAIVRWVNTAELFKFSGVIRD